MKRIKRGLFLSIEMLAVIIIIAVLMVVAALGVSHIINSYKVYSLSKELAMYSEAIIKYKQMYNYWPGDLPISKMVGELSNATVLSDKTTNAAALANGEVYPISDGYTSFQELLLAGLIPSTAVNISGSATSCLNQGLTLTTSNTHPCTFVKWKYPKLSSVSDAFIMFGVDYFSTITNFPANSLMYYNGTDFSGYNITSKRSGYYPIYLKNLNGTPKLVIISSKYSCSQASPFGCYNTINSTILPTSAISANLAYMFDVKIDTGKPLIGYLFSEDLKIGGWNSVGNLVTSYTGGHGCTTAYRDTASAIVPGQANYAPITSGNPSGKALKVATTEAEFQSVTYRDNDQTGDKGCVLTYGIKYQE